MSRRKASCSALDAADRRLGLAAVDAVTPDEIHEVATQVLGGQPSLAVIGPFAGHDFSAVVRAYAVPRRRRACIRLSV